MHKRCGRRGRDAGLGTAPPPLGVSGSSLLGLPRSQSPVLKSPRLAQVGDPSASLPFPSQRRLGPPLANLGVLPT